MKIKRRTLVSAIRVTSIISVIVVLSGLFYGYFLTNFFTIRTYAISGVDESTREIINNELKQVATKKIYKIFPNDKIFTYSNALIVASVLKVVPEVSTITMRPVGLNTVKIDIVLLTPVMRVSDTQALTVDGIIFTTREDIRKYPLIIIASSTTATIKRNGIVFTKLTTDEGEEVEPFLNNISLMTAKISSVIFPVATIIVEPSGDVTVKNEKGNSKIMFLESMDPKKIWSTLVSAIDTEPLKSNLVTEKDQLEYLDVRYGNKVFYRFSTQGFQSNSTAGILSGYATSTNATSSFVR